MTTATANTTAEMVTEMTAPDTTLCFAYGTLRLNQGNFRCMENAQGVYKGTGRLKEDNMGMVSLGGFPAVYFTDEPTGIRPVVELFEVPTERMGVLHRLEGYSGTNNKHNLYNLDKVAAVMQDGSEVEAWIYHMCGRDFDYYETIHSGDWVEYIKEKRGW